MTATLHQPTAGLVSAEQLAISLGITAPTVLRWYRSKKIPGIKITPKVLRFDLDRVLTTLGRK